MKGETEGLCMRGPRGDLETGGDESERPSRVEDVDLQVDPTGSYFRIQEKGQIGRVSSKSR